MPDRERSFDDFAFVRLTRAGLQFAGESRTLRLANAHSDYTFAGQTPQKVVRRGELSMFLAYTLPDGTPVFELAPEAAAVPVAIPTATSTAAPVQAIPTPEVTHAD